MKIKTISASGLKGAAFAHNLGPINIITGDNWSGKTARLDAIRLGLTGYLPELGKTPAATGGLASNSAFEVRLGLDNGQAIFHGQTRVKGSWKVTRDVPPCFEIPPVLMDPQEYFSLGDKDRVRYVFGLASIKGASAGAILGAIKMLRVEPDHTDAHRDALSNILSALDMSDAKRLGANQSVQDWLEAAIAEHRDKYRLAKANTDRLAKTVQGMVVLAAGDTEATARNVEREATACRNDLATARAGLAQMQSDACRLGGKATLRREITARIAPPDGVDMAKLEADFAAAQRGTEGFVDRVSATQRAQDDNRHAIATVDAEGKRLLAQVAEVADKLKIDLTAPACPHCGANKKGWQSKIESAAKARLAELESGLEALRERALELRKLAPALRGDYETAVMEQQNYRQAVERMTSLSRQLSAARGLRDRQAADVARLEAMGPAVEEAQLEALKADIAAAQPEIERLTERIAALDQRQRAWVKQRQDEARAAQAQLAVVAAQAECDVLKQVVAGLEAAQRGMVDRAFAGILAVANKVAGGLIKTPLEYLDGEIGRHEGATWVAHKTFSGTEKLVTYAGISVALAGDAPVKIVLMDELGRVDMANKIKLVETMERLIAAGVIDQFVGVDVLASDYACMELQVEVNVIEVK